MSIPAGERTNEKNTLQSLGNNWIELADAQGNGHETYGIERTVDTIAGAAYTLSLDYAGRLGYGADFTRIGIYVDGVQIATHAGTSPNEALNWETLSFAFTGTGTAQTIRIVTEAPLPNPLPQAGEGANEKGAIRPSAMIDNIVLTEVTAINTGYQDGPIRLSAVIAALTDTDGSEVIGVTIGAIPTGATLTDGVNSFTATDSMHIVAVTYWDLGNLSITAPTGYSGSFALTVAASAIETATGEISNSAVTLPVTVMPANVADSTAGGTTGHLTDAAQDAGHAIGYSSLVTELRGADLHTTALGDSIGSFDVLSHGRAINHGWDLAQDGLRNAAVIDWSAKAISGSEADDNKKKLKGKQPASWLAGFLGIDKPAASLAESTGLNVTMPAVEEPKKPFEER